MSMAVAAPVIDLGALRERRAEYRRAVPFPHVVLRSVLDDDLLEQVASEFPALDEMGTQFVEDESIKSAESRWERFGPATRRLLGELHSEPVLESLSTLTGVADLLPDPYLFGGGQHQIRRDGYLRVHADFNRHRRVALERRLNLLVYLNRDWDDAWGGQLELWDREMQRAVVTVAPRFNTLVVFTTTSTSFHGHPTPLCCPPGVTRKSIALYYYTALRDGSGAALPHSTLWQARAGEPEPRRRRFIEASRYFRAGARSSRRSGWCNERARMRRH